MAKRKRRTGLGPESHATWRQPFEGRSKEGGGGPEGRVPESHECSGWCPQAARKDSRAADSGQAPRRSSEQNARKAAATKDAGAARLRRRGPLPRLRPARPSTARSSAPKSVVARKAPNLNRERRIVRDDDTMASVPSSLDLDRRASAARTGRRELRERFDEHTETSPQ